MLQICQKDRVPSAVGLAACPECGHSEFWLQGQEPPPVEQAPVEVAEQAAPAAVELTDTEQEADRQAAQARASKPRRTPQE
jgi:predicted  nucleic acid-binding Zn-ribbon protein